MSGSWHKAGLRTGTGTREQPTFQQGYRFVLLAVNDEPRDRQFSSTGFEIVLLAVGVEIVQEFCRATQHLSGT
jgi:hypothetical protein